MKVILTEEQFIKLTESAENLDSPLYHYTYLSFLIGMLETGTFETSSDDFDYYRADRQNGFLRCGGEDGKHYARDYISFTRDKMYNVNMDKGLYSIPSFRGSYEKTDYIGPQVRIQFNPNFVKNVRNGRLQPYFFDSYPDQKEEKLYFEKDTKSIPLDTKYIEKIDILLQVLRKDDIPFIKKLFNFPEIVGKTRIYYIKYADSQGSIDRSNGKAIKDDNYKLYFEFLKGNEKFSTPLISLKNVLHYFSDDELSNYKEPSYMEKYYNGNVKDENEQWELNNKRKKYTDKIISLYNQATDEQKKEIRKIYRKYKDKLAMPLSYEVYDPSNGFYTGDFSDDVGYLEKFYDDVNEVFWHFKL